MGKLEDRFDEEHAKRDDPGKRVFIFQSEYYPISSGARGLSHGDRKGIGGLPYAKHWRNGYAFDIENATPFSASLCLSPEWFYCSTRKESSVLFFVGPNNESDNQRYSSRLEQLISRRRSDIVCEACDDLEGNCLKPNQSLGASECFCVLDDANGRYYCTCCETEDRFVEKTVPQDSILRPRPRTGISGSRPFTEHQKMAVPKIMGFRDDLDSAMPTMSFTPSDRGRIRNIFYGDADGFGSTKTGDKMKLHLRGMSGDLGYVVRALADLVMDECRETKRKAYNNEILMLGHRYLLSISSLGWNWYYLLVCQELLWKIYINAPDINSVGHNPDYLWHSPSSVIPQ